LDRLSVAILIFDSWTSSCDLVGRDLSFLSILGHGWDQELTLWTTAALGVNVTRFQSKAELKIVVLAFSVARH
jgi:hypothetical protein